MENREHINYRLIQEYEVPEWIRQEIPSNDNQIETTVDINGKSMRLKAKVNYNDDVDDDFSYFSSDQEEENKDEMLTKKRKKGSIKEEKSIATSKENDESLGVGKTRSSRKLLNLKEN